MKHLFLETISICRFEIQIPFDFLRLEIDVQAALVSAFVPMQRNLFAYDKLNEMCRTEGEKNGSHTNRQFNIKMFANVTTIW